MAHKETAPAQLGARHQHIGYREFIAIAVALMATNSLALDTMLPAFPDIAQSLNLHDSKDLSWIVSGFLLGLGCAQVVYGPLSDRYGRRPVLMIGRGSYAILGMAGAMASSFASLILLRVLQGAAVAATRVIAAAIVRDCYSGERMASVMSMIMMVFLAVPMLAPSIGKVLLLVMPWRGIFIILALFGLGIWGWSWARLPETLPPDHRRELSGAVVIDGFRTVMTHRVALGYILAMTSLSGATYGFINSVQPLFAVAFRADNSMPVIFALMTGMMGAASLLNAKIVGLFGMRRISHTALLAYIAIEIAHLAIVKAGHETLITFTLCQALTMVTFGLVSTNFSALAMEPLGHLAGTAASAQGCLSMVGGALVGLLIGRSFNGTSLPVTLGFVLSGGMALLCVLFAEGGQLFTPPRTLVANVTPGKR